MIDGGSGSDFASGDCVWILFDISDYHIRNVTSTSINVGGMDELRMGEGEKILEMRSIFLVEALVLLKFVQFSIGDDVAIGGQNMDTIYGGEGFNILAGDNSEIVFFSTHLNTAGTPSNDTIRAPAYSFWNIPHSIRSNCDKGKVLSHLKRVILMSHSHHFGLSLYQGMILSMVGWVQR